MDYGPPFLMLITNVVSLVSDKIVLKTLMKGCWGPGTLKLKLLGSLFEAHFSLLGRHFRNEASVWDGSYQWGPGSLASEACDSLCLFQGQSFRILDMFGKWGGIIDSIIVFDLSKGYISVVLVGWLGKMSKKSLGVGGDNGRKAWETLF